MTFVVDPHGAMKDLSWLLLVLWIPAFTTAISLGTSNGSRDTYTLPVSVALKDGDTFDYIVVGAGAAGSVLLVEAGGDPSALSEIPAAAMGLLGSNIDWQYPTVSNNVSCLASRGRQCRFSRGKCLGGSTSINYMLYTRGNRRDFDFNVTGWNWEDLKRYFLRYEGLQVLDRFPRSSIPYHNETGILKIDFFDDPQNPWHSRIINGFRALEFPYNRDVNGVSQIGVTIAVGYVYEGERMSTARAYLGRKDVQSKLKVAKNTLCTGVIIDRQNVTRGITVLPESALQPLQLFVRKEVILSAGTIGTPQILMLSGIGPAEHLQQMGIPVRVNLPVGDNMSDHVLPLIIVLVDRGLDVLADVGNLLGTIGQTTEFLLTRNGPLASNGLTDVNSFANTLCYDQNKRKLQNKSEECELPNMQIIHAYVDRNIIPLAKPAFQQATNFNDDVVDQLADANVNSAFIILSPVVLAPYSRGKIRLASEDPTETPAIFANYLSDDRDVDQMMRSIKIIEDLVQTPPFEMNNATILHLEFPGCPSYKRSRESYWRCYVRHMTFAVYHAAGTCGLGVVVDGALRVRGVDGLRVADLSVVPRLPRGNTEAVAVAVGERVVDLLDA